ncbi:hypothetical protein KA005_15930 [bacterium]|nr:hypothetical protein [bacterium]
MKVIRVLRQAIKHTLPILLFLYIRVTNDDAANITCLFQIYEIPVVYGGNLLEFQGFDSIEEMFEAEQKAQKAAAQKTKQWQMDLVKPGSYVLRTAHDLLLFSEILDPVETACEEDKEHVIKSYAQEHMKYYRFGKHYSVACREGEMGDIHVSTILAVITKEYFDAAREGHWAPPPHYK